MTRRLRAFEDHLWKPRIGKTDVVVWDAWDGLMEWMATERSGDEKGPENWKEWLHIITQQSSRHRRVDRIFLPEQVTFDPRSINASQTSDVEVINQDDIIEAETALTIANESTRLLALSSTEGDTTRISDMLPIRLDANKTPAQWRVWLTEWDRDSVDYKWAYTPDIGLPFDNSLIGSGDNIPLPTAYIAALIGPNTARQEATFVALVILSEREQDIFRPIGIDPEEVDEDDDDVAYERIRGKPIGPVQSRGVCLDIYGQVIQEVRDPFGFRPSLCRCGDLIVGVDQIDENWRLWNWVATQEEHLRSVLSLDPTCRSVYVRAEAEAQMFWLIEEVEQGVRVSKRDAMTLGENSNGQMLVGSRLLRESDIYFSGRERPLNPQRNPGLIPYKESLLILVMTAQDEMELYQIQ